MKYENSNTGLKYPTAQMLGCISAPVGRFNKLIL